MTASVAARLSTHAVPFAGLDRHAWDGLERESFYQSSRWFASVEGELSRESMFVLAEEDARPVAGLAAYLVQPGAYAFLDPPRVLLDRARSPELAPFTDPKRLARHAEALERRLGSCYPVAVCVSAFGFATGAVGDAQAEEPAWALVEAFGDLSREWGCRSTAFLYVDEAARPALAEALRQAGYAPAALAARARLPVRWESFDEYLGSLRSRRRARVRRETAAFAASGLQTDAVSGAAFAGQIEELAPLLANLQRKYGHGDLAGARATLAWADSSFRDVARLVVVRDGPEPVAFSLLFEVGDTFYAYLNGQTYDRRARESYAFFEASYYERVRLALRTPGIVQIDYGTEAYEAKVRRGCELQPLTSFFRLGDDAAALCPLLDEASRAYFASFGT